MIEIKVDFENNAEKWWNHAAASSKSGLPESCRSILLLLPSMPRVVVTAEVALAFRKWAETLPGWDDGPEHARHPFTFHEAP
jgi:hypothetical protein